MKLRVLLQCVTLALTVCGVFGCSRPERGADAEVIHWWTSGGESAAVAQLADAYRSAGGKWIDRPVALGEQARSVTLNRIAGGDPPTAAQFNTTRQFHELARQGLLANLDAVARESGWDQSMPRIVLDSVIVEGHYYAAPLSVHMPTWIWYSTSALRRAGILSEPRNFEEFIIALDKLRAAGLIPLALGGQPWQESILFTAVLANIGGRDLYLQVFREHSIPAMRSPAFGAVLENFVRLSEFTDKAAGGRNWNDATAMLIRGEAGFQVMGDWAKGEYTASGLKPERDYGCIPGLGENVPYIIQGDVFIFPKTDDMAQIKAQQLFARVVTDKATQLSFSRLKGSLPVRLDADASQLDLCARKAAALMANPKLVVGNGEMYMTPDQNGAMSDVITRLFHGDIDVATAQQAFVGIFST